MLDRTFIHISGIGKKTEQALWNQGIFSWKHFKPPFPAFLSEGKIKLINANLHGYNYQLPEDIKAFSKNLSSAQYWRLFPHCRDSIAYIDIETTGLSESSQITTIALYDGKTVHTYVKDHNLDTFIRDIRNYDAIVTYNGKCFDIPFIERFFGEPLQQIHFDLRYILHALGYSGGLKKCERLCGLDRGNLSGVDGYAAVLLWHEYSKSGNQAALETLLAYNIEDTVNLEHLLVHAFNKNISKTPFREALSLPIPKKPVIPYNADPLLVQQVNEQLSGRHTRD